MNSRTVLALAAVLALLVWFWVRGERFFDANGPAFDESVHLSAGYSYWTTGNFRLNREDPPLLKLFWAIPLLFKNDVIYPHDVARNRTTIIGISGMLFSLQRIRPARCSTRRGASTSR